jgi:hypothetical protein
MCEKIESVSLLKRRKANGAGKEGRRYGRAERSIRSLLQR